MKKTKVPYYQNSKTKPSSCIKEKIKNNHRYIFL